MSPKKRYPKLALLDHFERSIELNATNINGWTAFMFACRIGHKNVVQLLLKTKMNARDVNGRLQKTA